MTKLFALLITLAAFNVTAAEEPKSAETKKVCVDIKDKEGKAVKDAKGNPKQNCKQMKTHKKLEGTKIPEKK
jgi:hypothetical protein